MCGIAGIVSRNISLIRLPTLKKMSASLSHRGPDDDTAWINESGTAGFAHRRLCVIDTSPAAGQPMHYDERFSIVYNGEIYNYRELRSTLMASGDVFTTQSDTEVILAAYRRYGTACLDHFDGMFAFAIWDEYNQELFCARDRFGEKPFYYFVDRARDTLFFGSELKALYAAGIEGNVNHPMMLAYLLFGVNTDPVDASNTFDQHIKSLPASHHLLYSLNTSSLRITRYWDLELKPGGIVDMSEASGKLRRLLEVSVSRRLRSDVKVGVNLSGGVDSSSIAAVMRQSSGETFDAFTVVFPGFEKSEEIVSRSVAESFGLRQHTVAPTALEFLQDLDEVLTHHEAPFTSASVYAQYRLFKLAASAGVTVLLDGQGADEVFAGYDKYRRWRLMSLAPRFTAGALKLRQRLIVGNHTYIDNDYVTANGKALGIEKPVVTSLNDLLYFNIYKAGLEELLRYADRNSMAHGTEVRLPFLSHELVTFAFSLHPSLKMGDGHTKLVLREAVRGLLPSRIIRNKVKIGFEPPQKAWMETPEVHALVGESRRILYESGILNNTAMRRKLRSHDAYMRNNLEWRWLIAGQWIKNKKGSE